MQCMYIYETTTYKKKKKNKTKFKLLDNNCESKKFKE